MRSAPAKAELIQRVTGSRSPLRIAKAVMSFASVHDMTQRDIVRASGKSLGWIKATACSNIASASPWPDRPSTDEGRRSAAEKSRFRKRARERRAELVERRTKSYWPALTRKGRAASLLPYDHPAVEEPLPCTVQ